MPGQPSTRDLILEAAADLFAERGFAAASMNAIAEQADLTTGALYGHFEGKAELLLAVVERALLNLPMTQALEGSEGALAGATLLPRMASEYAAPKHRRLRRLAIEVHAAAGRDKRVAQLVSESNQRVVEGISAVLDQTLDSAMATADAARDRDDSARLLLVMLMGLQHLDTLAPALIGDPDWIRALEAGVARLLDLPAAGKADRDAP